MGNHKSVITIEKERMEHGIKYHRYVIYADEHEMYLKTDIVYEPKSKIQRAETDWEETQWQNLMLDMLQSAENNNFVSVYMTKETGKGFYIEPQKFLEDIMEGIMGIMTKGETDTKKNCKTCIHKGENPNSEGTKCFYCIDSEFGITYKEYEKGK